MLGGSGGMLSLENFDKNSAIWCNLGIPKYVITILKINNFKVTKSTTTEFNCYIFFPTNIDVHAIVKLFNFELKRGVWGSRRIFKKSNKMEVFPLFFCFLAGLPRSPKL